MNNTVTTNQIQVNSMFLLVQFMNALVPKHVKMYWIDPNLKHRPVSEELKSKRVWILNGRKEVGLQMVWILNGIWNQEAQPFEFQTNGRHFVKNHLKSGQKVHFWMVGPTIWKPDHLKSDLQKVQIWYVSGFQMDRFQIPTVVAHKCHMVYFLIIVLILWINLHCAVRRRSYILRAFFLRKKYNKNIWWRIVKKTKSGTKKWSFFGIVGIFSIGTFSTLKVGLLPMETTH